MEPTIDLTSCCFQFSPTIRSVVFLRRILAIYAVWHCYRCNYNLALL